MVPLPTPPNPFQRAPSRIRKAVRDCLLVVAAFALLGAQALSSLHYVLVPHQLCAVHGVLEDVAPSATAHEHADDVAVNHSEEKVNESEDAVSESEDEEDVHDACSVATRNEHGALLERPALEDVQLLDCPAVAANLGVSTKPDRAALLSSAPKTSPPSRT